MIARLLPIFFVITFWPLVVQSILLTLLAISLITHVPVLYEQYGFNTRLWLLLALVVLVQIAATVLVVREPAAISGSATPTATLALISSAWSTFAWVVWTEIAARRERKQRERLMREQGGLEQLLTPWWQTN